MDNEAEYRALESYLGSNLRAVLSPLILKHWDEILYTSGVAWETVLDELGIHRNPLYKPMPSVLENIFPRPEIKGSRPDALTVWRRAENYLYLKGLKPDDFAYHTCGREAIVFRIRGVQDMLCKMSNYNPHLSNTALALEPLERHIGEKLRSDSTLEPISIALVPYLRNSMDPGASPHNELSDISLPRPLIEKYAHITAVSSAEIERLMRLQGIRFEDKKLANMRSHRDLPKLFFVIDRRAAAIDPSLQSTKLLLPPDLAIISAYTAAQFAITEALEKKYGHGANAFAAIANIARGKTF